MNLINLLINRAAVFIPGARVRYRETGNGSEGRPDSRSFDERYSSFTNSSRFRPGYCIDYYFVRDERPYFASIFFDFTDHQLEYRLVRLAEKVEPADGNTIPMLQSADPAGDVLIDEGKMPWGDDDALAQFERVKTWIKQLVGIESPGQ